MGMWKNGGCCWGCKWGFKVIYKILHLVFSDWNDIIIWFTTILSLKLYEIPKSHLTANSSSSISGIRTVITYQIKLVFAAKSLDFFPQKTHQLGPFQNAQWPRLALHPFDEPPVVPPGDEAWKRLGHPEVFHVPKKPGGGVSVSCNHWWWWWIMRIFSGVYIRCIYITPTKVFSKFGQKLPCDLFITTGLVP